MRHYKHIIQTVWTFVIFSIFSSITFADYYDYNNSLDDEPTYPPVEENDYPVYNLTSLEIGAYFHGDDEQIIILHDSGRDDIPLRNYGARRYF